METITTTPSEVRARNLNEGDTFREYGLDEIVEIHSLDYFGDAVLVTDTNNNHHTLDGDEVVELNPQED